jgi:AraC-like DNA-binding protein/quercetin dioxygenase-like cupin family protein
MKMRTLYDYNDEDFGLSHSYSPVPDQSRFVLHTHAKAELYYFVGGGGVFHIEGTDYPLHSGDLLLMQSAESHYIELDKSQPYERKVLHFNLDVLKAIDPSGYLQRPFLNRQPGKQNLYRAGSFHGGSCEHYFHTMMNPSPDPRVSIFAGLIPLLCELCRLQSAPEQAVEPVQDSVGYRIIQYLNGNLDAHISLDDICQKFYISKSQLCRIFREATGVTVKQYLNAKRLVRAKQRIDAGELPTHVYLQCGFNDYSSFYRAYVKYYGTAPTR